MSEAERFSGCYRAARALSAFLFHTLFPVRYHDAERAQLDAPFILIGNHNSMLDPLIVGWKCKRYQIRYLGKRELTRSRLLQKMFDNLRMIAVSRHNSDMGAIRACLKALKDGHPLGVFPEGTRYKQGLMQELESGVGMIALRSDAPILPAYMTGRPRLFHRIDCYYGEPFTVTDLKAGGINKEACEDVLTRIRETYASLAAEHPCEPKRIRRGR